jgi:hypothetical protein
METEVSSQPAKCRCPNPEPVKFSSYPHNLFQLGRMSQCVGASICLKYATATSLVNVT